MKRWTEAELQALVVKHPPYRPPIVGIVIVVALTLLAIAILFSAVDEFDDCGRRGGAMVRGVAGYVCVERR